MQIEPLWSNACDHLRAMLNPDVFSRWIAIIKPLSLEENDTLLLSVDNDYYQTWLEDNYVQLIIDALKSAGASENINIRFHVQQQENIPVPDSDIAAAGSVKAENKGRGRRRARPIPAQNTSLNPKFLFEDFVSVLPTVLPTPPRWQWHRHPGVPITPSLFMGKPVWVKLI